MTKEPNADLIESMLATGVVPPPCFNEAIRQVLGIHDLFPSRDLVHMHLLDETTGMKIRGRWEEIEKSDASRVAYEAVAALQRARGKGAEDIEADHRTWQSAYWKYEVAEIERTLHELGLERPIDVATRAVELNMKGDTAGSAKLQRDGAALFGFEAMSDAYLELSREAAEGVKRSEEAVRQAEAARKGSEAEYQLFRTPPAGRA